MHLRSNSNDLDKDANSGEDQAKSFMVHLYPHVEEKYWKEQKIEEITPTLSFMCLNAGVGFK